MKNQTHNRCSQCLWERGVYLRYLMVFLTVLLLVACGPKIEPGADLQRANLSGRDLSGSDLTGADLDKANLSGAILRNVSLREIDGFQLNLSNSDLTGADLGGANLGEADLTGANLSNANLQNVIAMYANFSGADLTGADLSGANLGSSNLSSANLSSAILQDASVISVDLSGANLSNADLHNASLGASNLGSANLSGADLSGADLARADLTGADLAGATLDNANFSSTTGLTDEQLASAVSAAGARTVSVEDIRSAVEAACEGTGVPEAAAYDGGPGTHPVVLAWGDSAEAAIIATAWEPELPSQWQPQGVSSVQLVACIGFQQVIVETCQYILGAHPQTVYRCQHHLTIRLVEARTGELIDTATEDGGYPPTCPDEKPVNETDPTELYQCGSAVPFGQIENWLRGYVEP